MFICGLRKDSKDVLTFDLKTSSKTTLESMIFPRHENAVTKYHKRIYTFGGFNGENMKEAEMYSLTDKSWTQIDDMPITICYNNSVEWKDFIYITG
jgi:N-acetylneuraminic acid mutarotase